MDTRVGIKRGSTTAVLIASLAANWAGAQYVTSERTATRAEVRQPQSPHIVNGVLTGEYPSVGILLAGGNPNSARLQCSGTMIGCQTFLTAAHCVASSPIPSGYYVFLPHAGIFAVASLVIRPDYDFPVGDVAVLTLASPVIGVSPSRIVDDASPPPATPATIVGYGRTGGDDTNVDYGLKRTGRVTTTSCAGISNLTSLCWTFYSPFGPAGTNSNTCNGDSGGPLFVSTAGGERLAGITSGGRTATCLPTDQSFDANVFAYHAWVEAVGGADLANTSCGAGPQVGDDETKLVEFNGTLTTAQSQAAGSFDVTPGTTTLRVTLNGHDDGFSDFDLYVKQGSPASPSNYDCRAIGSNPYGACEFTNPALGSWSVLVNRYAGAGEYQVTATLLGTDCSDPGNQGGSCDDGNACTSSDVCQGGACSGTPVGNGTLCDDANDCTQSDACQSGVCTGAAVGDGAPCDDGDICSRPDTCQAGVCAGIAPALGCRGSLASRAGIFLLRASSLPRNNLAVWTFGRGEATSIADFGAPLVDSDFAFCAYDEVSGAPQRIVEQVLPGGSRWTATKVGYVYRDRFLSAGAVDTAVLISGTDGRSRVVVRGRGIPLNLPALPLSQQPAVRVQLLNDNACWESTYGTVIRNTTTEFRALSD
jgi:hypothetical protein